MIYANKEHTTVNWEDEQGFHSVHVSTLTPEQLALVDPYIEPPAPIPTIVTMRQARLALHQGGLLTTVNAAISAGAEADKITWEYATEVKRDDPLVANMATALNLSATDLDNLFTLAASL